MALAMRSSCLRDYVGEDSKLLDVFLQTWIMRVNQNVVHAHGHLFILCPVYTPSHKTAGSQRNQELPAVLERQTDTIIFPRFTETARRQDHVRNVEQVRPDQNFACPARTKH